MNIDDRRKINMTTLDFTKINWAGSKHILVTAREHCREPILILDKADIERLNEEWKNQEKK